MVTIITTWLRSGNNMLYRNKRSLVVGQCWTSLLLTFWLLSNDTASLCSADTRHSYTRLFMPFLGYLPEPRMLSPNILFICSKVYIYYHLSTIRVESLFYSQLFWPSQAIIQDSSCAACLFLLPARSRSVCGSFLFFRLLLFLSSLSSVSSLSLFSLSAAGLSCFHLLYTEGIIIVLLLPSSARGLMAWLTVLLESLCPLVQSTMKSYQ